MPLPPDWQRSVQRVHRSCGDIDLGMVSGPHEGCSTEVVVHRTDPLVGYMAVMDIECTERLVDSRVVELEE